MQTKHDPNGQGRNTENQTNSIHNAERGQKARRGQNTQDQKSKQIQRVTHKSETRQGHLQIICITKHDSGLSPTQVIDKAFHCLEGSCAYYRQETGNERNNRRRPLKCRRMCGVELSRLGVTQLHFTSSAFLHT